MRRVATLVARAAPADELFAAVTEEAGRQLAADFVRMARYESGDWLTILAGMGQDRRAFPDWQPVAPRRGEHQQSRAADRPPGSDRQLRRSLRAARDRGPQAGRSSCSRGAGHRPGAPLGRHDRGLDQRAAVAGGHSRRVLARSPSWSRPRSRTPTAGPGSPGWPRSRQRCAESRPWRRAGYRRRRCSRRWPGRPGSCFWSTRRAVPLRVRRYAHLRRPLGQRSEPLSRRQPLDARGAQPGHAGVRDRPPGPDRQLRRQLLRRCSVPPSASWLCARRSRRRSSSRAACGVVVAAGSIREKPLPSDTEARLASFTELVDTAIANAENLTELTASRARVVTAADETRRRIERDLHDGAQQRLVSLGLAVRAAQAAVPPQLGELEGELAAVAEGAGGRAGGSAGDGPRDPSRDPGPGRPRPGAEDARAPLRASGRARRARSGAAPGAGRGRRLLCGRRSADQCGQARARFVRPRRRGAGRPRPSPARPRRRLRAGPIRSGAPAWSGSKTASRRSAARSPCTARSTRAHPSMPSSRSPTEGSRERYPGPGRLTTARAGREAPTGRRPDSII